MTRPRTTLTVAALTAAGFAIACAAEAQTTGQTTPPSKPKAQQATPAAPAPQAQPPQGVPQGPPPRPPQGPPPQGPPPAGMGRGMGPGMGQGPGMGRGMGQGMSPDMAWRQGMARGMMMGRAMAMGRGMNANRGMAMRRGMGANRGMAMRRGMGAQGRKMPNRRPPGALPQRAIRQLNLTQAQQDQLTSFRDQQQKDGPALRDRMRTARQQLQTAMRADVPDEAAVKAASGAVASVQADQALQQARAKAQLMKVLTPEQQQQLKAFRAKGNRGARR